MKVLGIDIGGTGIKGAPVDIKSGKLDAERLRIPTPEPADQRFVSKTIVEIVKHFDWYGPIGCGFPAVIRNGIVLTASNIPKGWIGTDTETLFKNNTGCPVKVINDADAAGLAEIKYGAGRGMQGVILVVTVGTGIGSSLFVDGRLVPNTEFGKIHIKKKTAERYVSSKVRKKKEMSWKKWASRFNEYLNIVNKIFWPDHIIIGGGVSKKFDKFSDNLSVSTHIIPAQLKNDAGIIGAAYAMKMKRKNKYYFRKRETNKDVEKEGDNNGKNENR